MKKIELTEIKKPLENNNIISKEEFIPLKLADNFDNNSEIDGLIKDFQNKIRLIDEKNCSNYSDSDDSELWKLDIFKIDQSKIDKSIIDSLDKISLSYKLANDLDNALGCFFISLAYKKNIDEYDVVSKLSSIAHIGDIYYKKNSLQSALENYQDGIAICEDEKVNDNIYAYLLERAASIHYLRNDFSKALAIYSKSLEFKESKPQIDVNSLVSTFNAIGNVYYNIEHLELAKNFYDKSLDIVTKNANNSLNHAILLNNIGNIYYQRQNFNSALELYSNSLRMKVQHAQDSKYVSNSYCNIANIANSMNNKNAALQLYQKALEINKKNPNSSDSSHILNNIGILYYNFNDVNSSKISITESLVSLVGNEEVDGLKKALVLKNLANCYWSSKDYNMAIIHYQEAINIEQEVVPESLRFANSLNNFSHLLEENNNKEGSEYFFYKHIRVLTLINLNRDLELLRQKESPKTTMTPTSNTAAKSEGRAIGYGIA